MSIPFPVKEVNTPWNLRVLARLLHPWVRIKRDPVEPAQQLDTDHPVVYVIERHGLSDLLILDEACREAGMPSPLQTLANLPGRRHRPILTLSPRRGLFRPHRRFTNRDTVLLYLRALVSHRIADVQLQPVAIYVGRAPNRSSGWFRVLFSENWVIVGWFRRLLALLLNGRDTIVQFSPPMSLRNLLEEQAELPDPRMARKVLRILRVHLRRVRSAVIGPDLSHRRTVVDVVLTSKRVQAAIAQTSQRENIRHHAAWHRAQTYAREIAADYSPPAVRSASFLLSSFWNRLFDGIGMHHFDSLRAAAPGHEVIYVPCHRSHADYLLLSYQLYQNGLVPPHIAAGINLNLPLLGRILRRGGAFFLRRSFKANALYSNVFSAYVDQLFQRGVAMEYFVEGGRSRTGRLLLPRGGMLAITVRAFLRSPHRPVLFQPVYIGYEKLMEGASYSGELSGKAKKKESLLDLFSIFKVLRKHYGRVTLNFGEPILLKEMLDQHAPQWREAHGNDDERPAWFPSLISALAQRIQVEINRAADANPINLLALCMLATPKHALAEQDLIAQIDLYQTLFTELPYSDRVTLTTTSPTDIVAYGEKMGWIRRIRHPLGDVLVCEGDQAVLLSYFRNNVLHLVVPAAWIATCFLNEQRMAKLSILRLGRLVYPFIRAELFLPWDDDGFAVQLEATINFLVQHAFLESHGGGRVLERAAGQDLSAYQLRVLAHSLLQTFERYYIALAALVKAGTGTLTALELERICVLTAQRLSLLQQLTAPEFFDKSLFRGFIQQLRASGVIHPNPQGKLDFAPELATIVDEAGVILTRGVREAILKLAPGETLPGTSSIANHSGQTPAQK